MNARIISAAVVGTAPQTRWAAPNGGARPSSRDGSKAQRVLECGGPPPLSTRLPASALPHSASGLAQSKPRRALVALGLLIGTLCWDAPAQSFSLPWHTINGGGGTSTGGLYTITGTIGQPDAGGPMTGGLFSLTGGFWALPQAVQTPGAPTLTIAPASPGFATISWTPATGTN